MTVGVTGFDRGLAPPAAGKKKIVGVKSVVAILLFLGIATLGGLWFLQPPAVEAVHPRIGPAITAIYASGTVEASIMFPVAPRIGARLIAINKDEHNLVHKGELLGRLEATDMAGNVAQLEAQATFARNDYDRYARLMNARATTQQAYDHALATWNAATAAVRQARAQAGFMNLEAPGDCTVIERDGEIGQFIPANTPVFWLSCHPELRISAQVDEEDIPLVKTGQKVFIRADAFPGRIFQGSVTEVTPKGDPIGRSYRVRIGLPPQAPLHIGMTTEANIIARENPRAVLLPSSAVSEEHVWKIEDGRARRIPVTLGAKANDWVEITQGITPGDLVLRNAGAAPKDGKVPRIRQVVR